MESRNITIQPGEIDDRKSEVIAFVVHLGVKSISKNHCHLSSSKYPFLAMERIASNLNACSYNPSSIWFHNQTLFGVIRPLAGRKCPRFCRDIVRYRFHRYLCFHCMSCVPLFCITDWPYRTKNWIHSNITLSACILTVTIISDQNGVECFVKYTTLREFSFKSDYVLMNIFGFNCLSACILTVFVEMVSNTI